MMAKRTTTAGAIGAAVLAIASVANAQQTLTLDDAVARALAKNHDVRIERHAVDAADARVRAAYGDYDPKLRVEVGVRRHSDPFTSLFPTTPGGVSVLAGSENGFTSSATLTQLFQNGASARLSTSVDRLASNGVLSIFSPAYITSLGVEVQQPLLRSRAIDPTRASLRITALDRQRSGAVLERQALETVAAVEKAYWDLASARRQVMVRRASVTLAEEQREDTQVRIHARTIPKSDIAQPTAEVERRRGDVFAAEEQVARAERALKLLMLDDTADALWAQALEPGDMPEPQSFRADVERAVAEATRNRPELTAIGHEIGKSDVQIALFKDTLKPRVDLIASYTTREMSGDRFPDAVAGIAVEVPLGRRTARGELAAAEAGRRQSLDAASQTRQQVATEVRNAVTAIETAASRIQAARAGLTAAETQLRAEQDRFAVGATTNFFVLTRQTELAQAQITEIDAVTAYHKAITEFGRATGTLLRDRGIQITE
jgi:HAE1 family hydrophobic/amphiphilic exporter-1